MLTPSLNTVMTRLLIVAAVLATLMLIVPATFAQESGATIEYTENGTDPVRTFTSSDPEGAGIDWDVTGLDADFFSIDSRGMLMFNDKPNYESARDKPRDLNDDDDFFDYYDPDSTSDDLDAETGIVDLTSEGFPATVPLKDRESATRNNLYHITVRATETDGTTNRALSTEQHYTVEVINANESGSVTLDWIQPEVGTMMTAKLSDPDGLYPVGATVTGGQRPLIDGDDTGDDPDDVQWQWYISKVTEPDKDDEGHWTEIVAAEFNDSDAGTTADLQSTYVPRGDCVDDKENNTETTDVNEETLGCNIDTDASLAETAEDATARDEGKVLRVKATYTDRMGSSREAVAVSDNPVRAEVSSVNDGVENPDNGSPGFTAGLNYTREISEDAAAGDPAGAPVVAIDPNGDTLTYGKMDIPVDDTTPDVNESLATAGDAGYFNIDKATGQLSRGSKPLDYDNNTDGYKFLVSATDPSGQQKTVEVTINATAAADAPQIMGSLLPAQYRSPEFTSGELTNPDANSEIRVDENDDDLQGSAAYTGQPGMPLPAQSNAGLGADNVFTAADEDARGQIFWSLRGEDADQFVRSQTEFRNLQGLRGPDEPVAIRFASPPDYENPTDANKDSVYKVTLVATDSSGLEDTRDLTIFVDNVNEAGSATLSTTQPLIGQAITAEVSDPDNSVTVVTWQWQRSDTRAGPYTPIPGATTATYVPWKRAPDDPDADDDDSMFLRAIATYTDTTSALDESSTGNVDERVQMDLVSDVAGAKTASTTSSGIATVGGVDMKLYRVRVTSANAVRVAETTVDDMPTFPDAPYARMVVENAETGSIVGLPVTANYDKTVRYSINRADANDNQYFTIDPDSGQIRVGMVPIPSPTPADQIAPPADSDTTDEDPNDQLFGETGADTDTREATTTDPTLDYEGKNTFALVITAADAGSPGKKTTATVEVSLSDVNEGPYFDKASRESTAVTYAENRTTPVVALAAIEPDGADLDWELTGADAHRFRIDDIADGSGGKRDRVELVFNNHQPNYEAKQTYSVTVNATEETTVGGVPAQSDSLPVNVTIGNVQEGGSVEITWLQPEVNTELPVSLNDPDGDAASVAWQWYRAKVSNPDPNPDLGTIDDAASQWVLIGDSTAADDNVDNATGAYTPQGTDADMTAAADPAVDEGKKLLVLATYDDPLTDSTDDNDDVQAFAITAYPVQADVADSDNNSPDFASSNAKRTIAESVKKGDAVGRPVMVETNEDGDTLTYELDDDIATSTTTHPPSVTLDPDGDNERTYRNAAYFFSVDKATGQIRIKNTVSAEANDGRGHAGEDDVAANPNIATSTPGVYVVYVRATDPSGEAGGEDSDTIKVTVTVTDVNEAPKVTGADELWVNEANSSDKNSYLGVEYQIDPATGLYLRDPGDNNEPAVYGTAKDAGGDVVATSTNNNLYTRSEEDLTDTTTWPEPISGPDGALFEYSTPTDARGIARRIHFIDPPDFENPMDEDKDNVYEVTIVAEDDEGASGQKSVRIHVRNVDEKGTLTLSPDQPHLGGALTATLSDPDCDPNCDLTITDWDWIATTTSSIPSEYNFEMASTTDVIVNTTDSYTFQEPRDEGLIGKFIWVMVEYRDGSSVVDDPVTALDERNNDPDGVNDVFDLDVAEDGIGVTDDDDRIETKHDSDETESKGTPNALQSDPEGPDPSAFPGGTIRLDVPESLPSTGYVGVPVLAYDPLKGVGKQDPRVNVGGPDGGLFVFAEDHDCEWRAADEPEALNYDDSYYDNMLSSATTTTTTVTDDALCSSMVETEAYQKFDKFGQLALLPVTHLDYEAAKNTYTVEVMDEDAANALGIITVVITVTDVNEAPSSPAQHFGPAPDLNTVPEFAATSTTRMVAENTAAGMDIGDAVAATDVDSGDTLSYELGGADAASFAIDAETGQLMTSAALDYETKMEYMVTVTATDSDGETDMIYVTIMVTNEGLDNMYDMDDSGDISRDEVIMAIDDFLFGDGSVTRDDVIAVIDLFLFG